MFQKTKSKRRTGRGAVLVIVALLVSSALVRLVSGPSTAVAQALTAEESMTEPETLVATAPPVVQDELPMTRPEMGDLLTALRAREERVKTLENQIEIRSKALAVADAEITKRLAVLEQAEANLRETLALADGAAEGDLAKLTNVYESMKPKDAVALFQAMEPDFAAGFLGRMRPESAAAIMSGLPPEIAYSISAILAGRNVNAPKS